MPGKGRGLGWAYDDPLAIAGRQDARNRSMLLLAPLVPLAVPPDHDQDLGPTLDQGQLGACVAFAAEGVKSGQEHVDVGQWLFSTATALKAYDWLKNGYGPWPGDGLNGEGSYAQAVWKMARLVGLPSTAGARLIDSYYQLSGTPSSEGWIALQQQVMLAYGAVTISSLWPANWGSASSTTGLLPYPSSTSIGGHMYVRKGWTTGPVGPLSAGKSPTGRYWRQRQSWGTWGRKDSYGRSGEFLLPFEADGAYPNLQIGEIWKTLDVDNGPNPAPPPTEEIVKAYDATPRRVDVALGTPLYGQDGVTQVATLASGGLGLYSPCRWDAQNYNVRVTTGGVAQLVVVRAVACTNVRLYDSSATAVAAERKRWTDWHAQYPK